VLAVRRTLRCAAAAIGLLPLAVSAGAQSSAPSPAPPLVLRADRLLNAGRVFAAESLYYAAVQQDPRNPATRLALGKYLAERGALRVGAVLMEEARYFGGDPAVIARDLAPVYEGLDDWSSLAVLPASPLSAAERKRAEWLRDHPPAVDGPDTGTVMYRVTDTDLLGQVELRVGTTRVLATIDGRAKGLVLDTSIARRKSLRLFAASGGERAGSAPAAVAPAVHVGDFTLRNLPVTLAAERGPDRATIGLDLLARLAPTFDPVNGRMLLRKSGRVDSVRGFPIPTLTSGNGVFVVKTQTVFPLRHPDVQQYLRRVEWTLDRRKGEIVVASR
jgi:hypothetical protein